MRLYIKSKFTLPRGKVPSFASLADGVARRVKAVIAAGTTESRRRVSQNWLRQSSIKRRMKVIFLSKNDFIDRLKMKVFYA